MKAYGFSLSYHTGGSPWGSLFYGEVYTEEGAFLGRWVSSDLRFLEEDLKKHAKEYDYVFSKEVPFFLQEAVRRHHEKCQ